MTLKEYTLSLFLILFSSGEFLLFLSMSYLLQMSYIDGGKI